MKAAVYTRVSTESENQSQSLENQKVHYEDWCERNGYEMYHVYAERGLSGTNARRPQFIQLMHDAGLDHTKNDSGYDLFEESDREPKFNYIICKDVSRFSRSSHIGMLVIEYLRNKGVYVNFENSGLVTSDKDWHMRTSMQFTMAQFESENTSQRIKFAKKHNADNGIYRPARLPYSYEWNEKREIVINEDQAKVVRFIYDNYANEGSHILSRRLNEKSIPTQRGGKWSNDKITRIISNLIYTGTAQVGRTMKNHITDTKRVDIDSSKWIPVPNAVPQIITLEQYEAVNKIRKSRINKSTKRGRRPAVKDIYHGKLYCQSCGSRFVRHIGTKDKILYICQNRRKALGCGIRGISIGLVNEIFNSVNASSLMDGMNSYVGYNALKKRIETEALNLERTKNSLSNQINQLEEENNAMLAAIKIELLKGDVNIVDMFREDINKNKQEIEILTTNKEKVNIDSILNLKKKVEFKKHLIEEIHTGKRVTETEKMALLKEIIIGDYECTVSFAFPNYEEEIDEFNLIFPMAEIESVTSHQFTETIRRNHKAAREYWKEVDDSNLDYYNHYHYHEE